jgi:ATP-binding cassette subfamily F protein uup
VIAFEDGRVREYAGGYSDYLRQRPVRRELGQAPAKPASTKPVGSRAMPRSRSPGKKPQRELARVLARINSLQASIRALEQRLSDPDLFRRDSEAFAGASAELSALQAELGTAEERWLELEIEAERAP